MVSSKLCQLLCLVTFVLNVMNESRVTISCIGFAYAVSSLRNMRVDLFVTYVFWPLTCAYQI